MTLYYAKVINQETGLCEVGLGTNAEFYKSIGMIQLDVQQSDIDNNWYLTEKCPMKTDEQKKLIVQKIKKTKLEKYNDENYVNVNKAKQTVLSKYGVTSYLATKQCKNNSIKALKTRAYNRLLENERDRPCFTLEEFLAINSDIEYI